MTGRDSLRALSDFLDIPNVPEVSMPPLPDTSEPEIPNGIRVALRQLLERQYTVARARFGDDLPEGWGIPTNDPSPRPYSILSS